VEIVQRLPEVPQAQVRIGTVHPRIPKARIQFQGAREVRDRSGGIAARHMRGAAIVVQAMHARAQAQGRVVTGQRIERATQPLQGTPSNDQDRTPAEAKPGGDRPTTPAPEPARPDPQTRGAATKPALPAAPAEKIAPPIKEK